MSKYNMDNNTVLPYEKCIRYGVKTLTDEELMAVLLRTGTSKYNCMEVSKKLLDEFGSMGLLGLQHTNIDRLKKIEGIGPVKATMLSCIGEISSRIVRMERNNLVECSSSDLVASYYMDEMRHYDKEHMIVLLLDTKCRLIRECLLSIGTVNSTCVSPREVYMEALQYGAVNIILLHNHPSGDPTPSVHDMESTAKIMEAGNIIGIHLLDHIIIGDGRYVSFREINYL